MLDPLRELAAAFEHAIREFRDELQEMSPGPQRDLRGIEWLVLALIVLFVELTWLASQYAPY